MEFFRTLKIIPILALCVEIAGCGAFADAADHDAGQVDSPSKLEFDKTPYILQGQRKDFIITFLTPPTWSGTDGGRGFLTTFRFLDADKADSTLTDIQFIAEYDGDKTISATLQAAADANTEKRRIMEVEVAYEKTGQPQQHHKGTGKFWVLPKTGDSSIDGGTDGDGGSDGGIE